MDNRKHISPPSWRWHQRCLAVMVSLLVSTITAVAFCSPPHSQLQPTSRQHTLVQTIMAGVFAYAAPYDQPHLQYDTDLYLRHHMQTKRRGPLTQLLPDVMTLEHGEHHYLSEAHLRLRYRQPGVMDCKVVAHHTTLKRQHLQRLKSIGQFSLHIYATNLFTAHLLNPLHKRNQRFYHYTYRYTLPPTSSSAHPAVRIGIRPRFSNDRLVRGVIDVDLSTYAVKHFTFTYRDNLDQVTVSGTMGKEGYATLVPEHLRINCTWALLGNRIADTYEVWANHRFSCALPTPADRTSRHDLTAECWVRLDTTRVINDVTYFDTLRPIPLRQDEWALAHQAPSPPTAKASSPSDSVPTVATTIDSIYLPRAAIEATNEAPAAATSASQRWTDRTEQLLLNAHSFTVGQQAQSTFRLPPILTPSMLQWSRTKGFALKMRFQWSLTTPATRPNPLLSFQPNIGYNFKQRQVYWNTPLRLQFAPHLDGVISIDAGGGEHMYNNQQADEIKEFFQGVEAYDSLCHVIDSYHFNDYRDLHLKADAAISPTPGLRLTAGLRAHRRTLINWNELTAITDMHHRLSTLGPRLQVDWTPGQYYYRSGRRRLPLYAHYPTFTLTYERGFSVKEGTCSYERLEADIYYRHALYATRALYFRLGSGWFTRRGSDCFLDYDFFRFNHMPSHWNDELTGETQLLSARWFNESNYYVRLGASYESPMLLLSRIPFITRAVRKEQVYFHCLSVRSLPIYTELGYGITTMLGHAGVFMGIAPDRSITVGCKVALNLFGE